jgi:hypothetical protein
MRCHLIALPLLLCAAPVQAQSPAKQDVRLPQELKDPQLTGRLVDAMQVLAKSFLDLPVGQVEAAMNGRPVTQADRRRTVASETGMSERELQRKIEESRPAMEGAQKALVDAIPVLMRHMSEMGKELEKVGANVPRPDYPKR